MYNLASIKITELPEGVAIFQDWMLFVNPDGTHKKGKIADIVKQGWTPLIATEIDGDRVVVKIIDWVAGFGEKPDIGYLGETGIVEVIEDAVDVRGLRGYTGWVPLLRLVADGDRIVQEVYDWLGDGDDKPNTGYIGETGLVPAIEDAIDIRGLQGLKGDRGVSVSEVNPTLDWKLDFSFSEGPDQQVDLGLSSFKTSIESTASNAQDSAIAANNAKIAAETARNEAIAAKWFPVVTESTASRLLALTDAGKEIRCTFATAITVTVPPQVDVAWADYTEIIVVQAGSGQITFVPGSGVTINSSETLKSLKQYSYLALKRVALNVWDLTGERQLS